MHIGDVKDVQIQGIIDTLYFLWKNGKILKIIYLILSSINIDYIRLSSSKK